MQHHPFEQMTAIATIDPDAPELFASPTQALEQKFGSCRVGH